MLFRPGVGSGHGAGVLMENNNMFIFIFIVQQRLPRYDRVANSRLVFEWTLKSRRWC